MEVVKLLGLLIKKTRIEQNISQAGLCEGICSASYLSKIESGAVKANDEIYELLFEVMGIKYEYEQNLISKFKSLSSTWYENCLFLGSHDYELERELLELSSQLIFSPMYLNAYLLNAMLAKEVKLLNVVELNTSDLNDRQLLLYNYINSKAASKRGDHQLAIRYLNQVKSHDAPFVYMDLAYLYAYFGYYDDAIVSAMTAYEIYSKLGHVDCMFKMAAELSICYYNKFDLDNAFNWDEVAERLSKVLNYEDAQAMIYYNRGATLTDFKNYEEAQYYLKKSLELSISLGIKDLFNTYQKLGINSAFLCDAETLRMCIEKIEDSEVSEEQQLTLELLKLMQQNNFTQSRNYCDILNTICKSFKNSVFKGKFYYFQSLLYDAYKSTRQYKKAIELKEDDFPRFSI